MNRLGLVASALILCLGINGSWIAPTAAHGGTLADIQERGLLQCGVTRSGEGLSETDSMGEWKGFFPDFCRAIAAATLGDPEAVDWVEVDFVTRFEAMDNHAFDVLIATTTWTMSRDVELGLAFTHPLLFDGQGFLGHASLQASRLDELDEATVCVHDNTTTIANLRELVRTEHPQLQVMSYRSDLMGLTSFFSRQCDLLSMDRTALIAQRASRGTAPENYVLFEDTISREPLGPAVRQDDVMWFDIVQWIVFALIIAEEHGVTQANVTDPALAYIPEVARLLGAEGEMGATIGLTPNWAFRAIQAVGNYGEVFDRHLGPDTPLQTERGINALWRDGGLIYAPPLR